MKKKIIITFCVFFVLIVAGLGFGVNYMFNYAIVSGDKDFIKSENVAKLEKKWAFSEGNLSERSIMSDDGLKLNARYVTQPKETNTTVIVAHGYMSDGLAMGQYAEMFYKMGYDVLVPDNRGHGTSEGKYVGFGWLDRLDYVKWIDEVLKEKGAEEEIILFGVSMGASTVMMTSGEKLPPQVKLIIADCGYDTVQNELTYQLDEMFSLPAFPIVPLTSMYTDMKVGYNFKEASASKQLAKNKLPLLLIHGDKDTFVPTKFVYNLYDATKGPKEMVLFEGADHAESFKSNPEKYETTITEFISKYLPKK